VSNGDDKNKDREHRPSGHVRHEPGGRAVWQWAVDSGKHAIDSTSRLLKKLDISQLRLVDEEERQAAKRAAEEAANESAARPSVPSFGGMSEKDSAAQARRSFDPYDSRTLTGRGVSAAPRPRQPAKPRITQPVRPKPEEKPGLLGRLFGKGK
jgi:hypothetical protein